MNNADQTESLISEGFDLEVFQSDVLVALRGLQQLDMISPENLQVSSESEKPSEDIHRLKELLGVEDDADEVYIQREKTIEEAKEVVKREDIRAKLCPALSTLINDAFEIAKVVTPILAPFALVGSIPLNAALFATVALVITRMGISTICNDYKKENS